MARCGRLGVFIWRTAPSWSTWLRALLSKARVTRLWRRGLRGKSVLDVKRGGRTLVQGAFSVHISTNTLRAWAASAAVSGACGIALLLSSCERAAIGAPIQAQATSASAGQSAVMSFSGKVVGVADGDTITVLIDGNREAKIRFAEIDAPEKGQPWGNRSKQTLSDLVFGRDVRVQQMDVDRWGRIVGRVFVDNRDVNREMVAVGAAWVFRRYLTDTSLIEVEVRAKRERVGLWSMPEAQTVAPWDWRRGTRAGGALPSDLTVQSQGLLSSPSSSTGAGSFSCRSKTRCAQMTSCAEARFYLTQCRLESIDGNRDGEPCEQLCQTGGR